MTKKEKAFDTWIRTVVAKNPYLADAKVEMTIMTPAFIKQLRTAFEAGYEAGSKSGGVLGSMFGL